MTVLSGTAVDSTIRTDAGEGDINEHHLHEWNKSYIFPCIILTRG